MKVTINLDIEIYPDGEVILFDDGGEVLMKLTKKQTLESMRKNLRQCDWLTKQDLRAFANDLIGEANEDH